MLGEQIGQETGKVTSRRILPGDGDMRFVRMEITVEMELKILGESAQDIATYTVVERGPGQMYGQGQGIVMLQSGEAAIWNGHGVGRIDESGGMHFAASVVYQTSSEKLARLNSMLGLIEHHVDAQNNAKSTITAWTA